MINLLNINNYPLVAALGLLFAFAATCIITSTCKKFLPKDLGREFAHDGKLSEGKPRGAGIIFILVFAIASLLFTKISVEIAIYIGLVVVEMLTGFFDDKSDKPWNEYKKGILDLAVAIAVAVTFLHYNSNVVDIISLRLSFEMPKIVFGILTVILVWVAINVTNCTDGVDGLSGVLAIVTLVTIYVIDKLKGNSEDFAYVILILVICILGYLWYNATPSNLLMGDAGSRAIGIFIAIAALKTGSPFIYILVAAVFIADGGLGLIKVALLRFLKIHILTNTRTPLHDHVRKNKGWSNTQTVFRFAIIQIVISIATVYMLMV